MDGALHRPQPPRAPPSRAPCSRHASRRPCSAKTAPPAMPCGCTARVGTASGCVHRQSTHRICKQRRKLDLACACKHRSHREKRQRRRYAHACAHRCVGRSVDAGRHGAVCDGHLTAERARVVDLRQQRCEHEAYASHNWRGGGPTTSRGCGGEHCGSATSHRTSGKSAESGDSARQRTARERGSHFWRVGACLSSFRSIKLSRCCVLRQARPEAQPCYGAQQCGSTRVRRQAARGA